MNKSIVALLLAGALSAPAFASNDEDSLPAPESNVIGAISVLKNLIAFSFFSDWDFARDMEGVLACARDGGAIGLRTEAASAAVLCEKTVAHDTQREAAVITAALLDAYGRARTPAVRVDGGQLGYGTARPSPGGMPNPNWTPITPEHAGPAVRAVISDLDRIAFPSDEPCRVSDGTPPQREGEIEPGTQAPPEGHHPDDSLRNESRTGQNGSGRAGESDDERRQSARRGSQNRNERDTPRNGSGNPDPRRGEQGTEHPTEERGRSFDRR